MINQNEYNKLMQRMHGLYNVTELQSKSLIINKDAILNIVTIDRSFMVQNSQKEAYQANSTDNISLTKTESTPYHATKDAKRGDNDK